MIDHEDADRILKRLDILSDRLTSMAARFTADMKTLLIELEKIREKLL